MYVKFFRVRKSFCGIWKLSILCLKLLFRKCVTYVLGSEAATRGVLWKKVFLEFSQNSQENTRARISFLIKLQVSGLQLY